MKVVYKVEATIPITIEQGNKGWYATSRLVRGLLARGDTEQEALTEAQAALQYLAQAALELS